MSQFSALSLTPILVGSVTAPSTISETRARCVCVGGGGVDRLVSGDRTHAAGNDRLPNPLRATQPRGRRNAERDGRVAPNPPKSLQWTPRTAQLGVLDLLLLVDRLLQLLHHVPHDLSRQERRLLHVEHLGVVLAPKQVGKPAAHIHACQTCGRVELGGPEGRERALVLVLGEVAQRHAAAGLLRLHAGCMRQVWGTWAALIIACVCTHCSTGFDPPQSTAGRTWPLAASSMASIAAPPSSPFAFTCTPSVTPTSSWQASFSGCSRLAARRGVGGSVGVSVRVVFAAASALHAAGAASRHYNGCPRAKQPLKSQQCSAHPSSGWSARGAPSARTPGWCLKCRCVWMKCICGGDKGSVAVMIELIVPASPSTLQHNTCTDAATAHQPTHLAARSQTATDEGK